MRQPVQEQILNYFLTRPTTEIHLRQLERELGVSAVGIRKAIREHLKSKIVSLRKDKHTRMTFYKANRDLPEFMPTKRCFNLLQIYRNGLAQYLTELYHKPEAIVLFGSYARGEDREDSDIDIAIITRKRCSADLTSFEKKLSRKVKILELSKDKIEKEFWNTLANGIVLSGYLELPYEKI